jgi:hypothetical protein
MLAALIHPYVVEIQKLKENVGKVMQIEILNKRLEESEQEIQFVKETLKRTSVLNMLSQKLISFVYWPTREELAESNYS